MLGVLSASTSPAPSSNSTELHVRLQPPSRWRLGFNRIGVCESLSPGKVGWQIAAGPISVSRLTPWRWLPPTNTGVIFTNVTLQTGDGSK